MILPCTITAAPPKKINSAANRKRITVFSITSARALPVIFLGQLENQLISSFSSMGGFSTDTLAASLPPGKKRLIFADHLVRLSTNLSPTDETFSYGNKNRETTKMQDLATRYLIVFPEISGFSLIHRLQTETNRHKEYRTNVIRTLQDDYVLSVSLKIEILKPYTGQISAIGTISVSSTNKNKFALFSAAVVSVGARLARILENSTAFDLETEVNLVDGNTVYFFNKYAFKPAAGQEFAIFKLKRYEDGFIDEIRQGTIRIIDRYGTFWAGRIIEGMRAKTGYRIRPEKHTGITLTPGFTTRFVELEAGRFSVPATTGRVTEAVSLMYGPSLTIGFQMGFNFQWYLEADFLFADQLLTLNTFTGFGWDLYVGRNVFFTLKFGALFRWLWQDLGTISDATAFNGKTLLATAFQPGAAGSLRFNWIMGRMAGGLLLFSIEGGYAHFPLLRGNDWSFSSDGRDAAAYQPASIQNMRTGGLFGNAGLGLRF